MCSAGAVHSKVFDFHGSLQTSYHKNTTEEVIQRPIGLHQLMQSC
jgi:hypothetical protein